MNPKSKKKSKKFLSEKGRKYNCNECGKQMAKKSSLYTHLKAAHERLKYSCQQCKHQVMSKGNLEKHKKSVHEGTKYPCEQCEH